MTDDELQRIKELDAARTPGEFDAMFYGTCVDIYANGVHLAKLHWGTPSLSHEQRKVDATFFAACSTAVPAMIAEIERLKVENDDLRARCGQ